MYLLATKPMAKFLRHLASHQEVSGLRTGLKFDFFSFKFFQIVQFFSHFCSCAFLWISANLEFISINFIMVQVPPVQIWSLWTLEVTYSWVDSHCDSLTENTPNASKNFSPIFLPKPKSLKFLEKNSLWVSAIRDFYHWHTSTQDPKTASPKAVKKEISFWL